MAYQPVPPLLGAGIELDLVISDTLQPGHFRVTKITTAARAVQLPLPVSAVTDDELLRLCPLARQLALRVRSPGCEDCYLAQSNTALRYIAELFPASGLRGDGSSLAEGFVDQWLDGTHNEYEVPLLAVHLAADGGPNAEATAAEARKAMVRWLKVVDAALAGRTYLVGHRPTIADIALACAFGSALGGGGSGGSSGGSVLGPADGVADLHHLLRWYGTVTHLGMFEGAGLSTGAVPGDGKKTKSGAKDKAPAAAAGASKPAKAAAPAQAKGAAKGSSEKPAIAAVREPAAVLDVFAGPDFGTDAAGVFSSSAVVEFSAPPPELPSAKFRRRRVRVRELLRAGVAAVGKCVTVRGWLRTMREGDKGKLLFLVVNDGSCQGTLQCVAGAGTTAGFAEAASCGGVGACVAVTGTIVESPAKGQDIEMQAADVEVLGKVYGARDGGVGGEAYPLAKKHHTVEYLRSIAHLRPRSKMGGAAMRVRHAMAFATHQFFNDRGFMYVHTPLITAADCEGAGEQFVVTTVLGEDGSLEKKSMLPTGKVDFSKDFFGKRACLTVSGQLNVETHCCALGDVYTFGPTFRAEHSITSRHLAEFWMIEPELAFATLEDDMNLAEDYLKYLVAAALSRCDEDLAFFEEFPGGEKGLRDRLRNVLHNDFVRITYTQAVELLQSEVGAGKVKFERQPEWGDDLGSEHERYITEKIYKRPVIVTNYPKGIKAFYMKLDGDGKTVAAMDILVPKIGEIIGGSQREENLEVLRERAIEMGLQPSSMDWYLDLRRYGTMRHAGFGLGFERLVLFVTGLENIKDVIPFPRAYGAPCEY